MESESEAGMPELSPVHDPVHQKKGVVLVVSSDGSVPWRRRLRTAPGRRRCAVAA